MIIIRSYRRARYLRPTGKRFIPPAIARPLIRTAAVGGLGGFAGGLYYRSYSNQKGPDKLREQLTLLAQQDPDTLIRWLASLSDHFIGNFMTYLATEDPDRFICLIKMLPDSMQDALVVRLADGVTMRGKTFIDWVTTAAKQGCTRLSVQVGPYPWISWGAGGVMISEDGSNVYIVYARQAGANKLTLPGGYGFAPPCPGHDNVFSMLPASYMDRAERAVYEGKLPEEAYTEVVTKHKLQAEPQAFIEDLTANDCASREVAEETNINVPAEQWQIVDVFVSAKFIPHIDFTLSAKIDYLTPRQPDGDEVVALPNVNVGSCRHVKRVSGEIAVLTEEDVEIDPQTAIYSAKAIINYWHNKIREESIIVDGYSKFNNVETVLADVYADYETKSSADEYLRKELGLTPVEALRAQGLDLSKENVLLAQFGPGAVSYYQKVVKLAQKRASKNVQVKAEKILKKRM